MSEAPKVQTFRAAQIGWKHRKDLWPHAEGKVWELPDGRFYISPPDWNGYIQVLDGDDQHKDG